MFLELPGSNQIWYATAQSVTFQVCPDCPQHNILLAPSLGTAWPKDLCTHTLRSTPTYSLWAFTSLLHPSTSSQLTLPLLRIHFLWDTFLDKPPPPRAGLKPLLQAPQHPALIYTAALQHLLHSKFTCCSLSSPHWYSLAWHTESFPCRRWTNEWILETENNPCLL